MPISIPITIRNLTQAEFDKRDRVVMRCAYDTQNELGRLCDERVYENDLALRLQAAGMMQVHAQVPVTVSHDGFEKCYRFDLVVEDALYELKTVVELVGAHDAQSFHYAMLADVNQVKLLNFRPAKVQGRLRFNALTLAARRRMQWETSCRRPLSKACALLEERLRSMMSDWGGFLDSRLYEEALIHFSGGESQVVRRVPIFRDEHELGSHAVNQHAEDLSFVVTAFSDARLQRPHYERLLRLTGLRGIQWFNLNHATVECVTLEAERQTNGVRRI